MNLNATLIAQIVVFLILWAFTMKFVWPPITKALDERASKIAGGLAAADKAKAELASANQRVQQELAQSREDIAKRIADAEKTLSELQETKAKFEKDVADAEDAAADVNAQIADASKSEDTKMLEKKEVEGA